MAAAFQNVPQAPTDQMFGLSAAYRADEHVSKVDLGVGAYRDENARPWVLSVVKKARKALLEDTSLTHEYLPIAGLAEYTRASAALVFGKSSPLIAQKRIASVQTLSGTGALSLGARFLARFCHDARGSTQVFVSDPPYANHIPILVEARIDTALYPYYGPQSHGLAFEPMTRFLANLPDGAIVLLHACAHNPTGVDPSHDQWTAIAQIMKQKQMLPFFDSAYQGFASGDLDHDAWAVRHFVEAGFDTMLVAQSYAKNFGLYGERAGCLHVVASNSQEAQRVMSQLERLQRVNISTPPAFSARIVSLVLNDAALFEEWKKDLTTMASRVTSMRRALRSQLEPNRSSTAWQHITEQVGMFCFSGLSREQVSSMREKYHVYMTPDGRMSISGLNERNVEYVGRAVRAVLRESKL